MERIQRSQTPRGRQLCNVCRLLSIRDDPSGLYGNTTDEKFPPKKNSRTSAICVQVHVFSVPMENKREKPAVTVRQTLFLPQAWKRKTIVNVGKRHSLSIKRLLHTYSSTTAVFLSSHTPAKYTYVVHSRRFHTHAVGHESINVR